MTSSTTTQVHLAQVLALNLHPFEARLSWTQGRSGIAEGSYACANRDGSRAGSVPLALATRDGPARLVEAIAGHGGLDFLVDNVGVVQPCTGGFLSVTDDRWAETLTINFLAAVRVTRAALPHLVDRGGGGRHRNSVNARLPDPLVIDYSAAKAALAAFCKALPKDVAPHGIRVTTVSPGPVAAALWLGPGDVAAIVARGRPRPIRKA